MPDIGRVDKDSPVDREFAEAVVVQMALQEPRRLELLQVREYSLLL